MVLSYFESLMIYRLSTGIAQHIHNKMLFYVSRAPLSFFDANPLGRIITRFSKDAAILDNRLPETQNVFYNLVFKCALSVILSAIVYPFLIIIIVIIFVLAFFVRKYSIVATNDSLKWDAVSRGPINTLYASTLGGVMQIRAYRKQEAFERIFMKNVDENGRAYFTYMTASRWLGFVLDMLIVVYMAVGALFAIFFKEWLNIEPALIAMSLTVSTELGGLLQFSIRQYVEMENSFTSVQRAQEYC